MEEKRKNIFQLSFPEEVVSGMPRLILHGKERVMIEQHRGIVTCQEELIRFQTACGILSICGSKLEIRQYGPVVAMIHGQIYSVGYEMDGSAATKRGNEK